MSYDSRDVNVDQTRLRAQIDKLNNDELKRFLNDDNITTREDLYRIIENLPEVQELDKAKELEVAKCKSIAENTLVKEQEYNEVKQRLAEVFEETLEMKKEVEAKKNKLDDYNRQTNPEVILALLQAATAEADEEAENVASSFFAGNMRVNEFLTQFIEKRKLAHLRRIKAEKLTEMAAGRSP